MEVQLSPAADSIDRFDSAVESQAAPTIRKDFPESFLWEDLEGYDEDHDPIFVFSSLVFWLLPVSSLNKKPVNLCL